MSFILVASVFLLTLDPLTDWYFIEISRRPVNHSRGAILFALGLTIISGLDVAAHVSPGPLWNFYGVGVEYILERGAWLIMIPAVRWIYHDLLLNIWRGKPVWYQGDGVEDAATDNLLRWLQRKASRPLHPFLIKGIYLALSSLLAASVLLISNFLSHG